MILIIKQSINKKYDNPTYKEKKKTMTVLMFINKNKCAYYSIIIKIVGNIYINFVKKEEVIFYF